MIVHTINKPSALALCEGITTGSDVIVLLEDGVYLSGCRLPGRLVAIAPDLAARGVPAGDLETIDYSEFVKLCAAADKVCAWF